MIYYDKQITHPHWYALHTKCHAEKKITMRLEGKGIETFFPVRILQRKWKDRKKMVEFPLFPGYVFVKMPLIQKREVVQTSGIVRVVGQGGPEVIPEIQIEGLRTFVETEIDFDPYPYLVPGVAVEVRRGPLKGVKGVLENKKNVHRLIINVELINNSVATQIDACDVQPL